MSSLASALQQQSSSSSSSSSSATASFRPNIGRTGGTKNRNRKRKKSTRDDDDDDDTTTTEGAMVRTTMDDVHQSGDPSIDEAVIEEDNSGSGTQEEEQEEEEEEEENEGDNEQQEEEQMSPTSSVQTDTDLWDEQRSLQRKRRRRNPDRRTIGDYINDTLSGEPMSRRMDGASGSSGDGQEEVRPLYGDDDDNDGGDDGDGGAFEDNDEWETVAAGGDDESGEHNAGRMLDSFDPMAAVAGVATHNDASSGMPQLRIVDGQIVLGETSMLVPEPEPVNWDRFERVVESESTRRITASTYARRKRGDRWTDADVSKFYRGLRQFGTDFTMISRLFPGRSRREIKNRFKKEQRENMDKVSWALTNKLPIDFEEFQKLSEEKDRVEGTLEESDSDTEPGLETGTPGEDGADAALTAGTPYDDGTHEDEIDEDEWESSAIYNTGTDMGSDEMDTALVGTVGPDGFERVDETEGAGGTDGNHGDDDDDDQAHLHDTLDYITQYGIGI